MWQGVYFGRQKHPALGSHLYDALNAKVPVIGVAKNPAKSTPAEYELCRGSSRRPLYITAAGMALDQAKKHIAGMHGLPDSHADKTGGSVVQGPRHFPSYGYKPRQSIRIFLMSQKRKNIFLTGAPSSGKTTVIRKVIASLPSPANGFYTQESKQGDRRVGFMMHTLDGKQGWLAHQDIPSDVHIRRYGVSIENIDTLAVPSIAPVKNAIIILDEIGKMECFSLKFRQAAIAALEADNIVIGTITLGHDEFILSIKARTDLEILDVTPENRDGLPDVLLQKISTMIP